MKKEAIDNEQPAESEAAEMLSEYDFRGAVRGKYAHLFRNGYTVRVHRKDGTIETQRVEGSYEERKRKS